jgi:hypothetical protein
MLRGRHSECDVFDRLLETVRAGRSGTLVMCGKPRVGKTGGHDRPLKLPRGGHRRAESRAKGVTCRCTAAVP